MVPTLRATEIAVRPGRNGPILHPSVDRKRRQFVTSRRFHQKRQTDDDRAGSSGSKTTTSAYSFPISNRNGDAAKGFCAIQPTSVGGRAIRDAARTEVSGSNDEREAGGGFAFSLFTPEATLFNDDAEQIITHFFSVNPNPDDGHAIRATWEHSRDTSTVWGAVTGQATVSQDAINWLRVEIKGAATGPTGGSKLTRTKFIQRINTVGGLAPAYGCAAATDVGSKAFVPYTADYLFYSLKTREQ
jgi:hypothetical protein